MIVSDNVMNMIIGKKMKTLPDVELVGEGGNGGGYVGATIPTD